jgi:tRNA pseudouridine38-40 synthase
LKTPEKNSESTADNRRWRLTLAYNGAGFNGWERQAQGERTVQGELEDALGRLAGERVRVVGAGRTDSGVHALGQVAAADLPGRWEGPELLRAVNAVTPSDIRVLEASEAAPDFHPQYEARSKTYFYQLMGGEFDEPFRDAFFHRLPSLPEIDRIRAAAGAIRGERDFSALMASGSPVQSTVRNVFAIRVRGGRDWMRIFITADGFLYKMIRNMVSLLVAAASGAIESGEADAILASRDRGRAPPTFPAKGLFLWKIRYQRGCED